MPSGRILVVDDDPGIRKGCRLALEQEGYAVETAGNGDEALAKLDHSLFDLVLTDLQMPAMTGLELLREIRHRSPELPVVLFTAFSSIESAGEALSLGVTGYLAKPFELDELYAAVKKALKGPVLPAQRATALLSSDAVLGSFLNFLVELTARTLRLESCAFLIVSDDATHLVVRAAAGHNRKVRLGDTLPLSATPSNALMLEGPLRSDPRFQGVDRFLPANGEGLPVCEGRKVLGLLVADRGAGPALSEEDRSLLDLYARYASILVSHANAYLELQGTVRKLEEAQSQLVQQAKLSVVGQLVTGLVHDINNPLTSILTNASHLRRTAPDGAFKETAEVIEKGGLALKAIVTSLMGFVRKDPKPAGTADTSALIHEAVLLVQFQCRMKRVQTVIQLEEPLPRVWVDGPQLQQVILNLLMNAIQALPAGGKIALKAAAVPAAGSPLGRPEVRVSVTDNGAGIPEDVLPRIFEPFFTTKRPGEGTGLGLARCREIVESHGGRIRAENAEGGGARFWVHLPADEPLSAAVQRRSVSDTARDG